MQARTRPRVFEGPDLTYVDALEHANMVVCSAGIGFQPPFGEKKADGLPS